MPGSKLVWILLVCAFVAFPAIAQGGRLYWGQWFPGAVYTAELDGSSIELLVVDEPGRPTGMAFDTNTQLLHWVQWIGPWPGYSFVRRGTGCDGNIGNLTRAWHARGLAIDPIGGFLYWTDIGETLGSGRIVRAKLDGSNQTILISGIRAGGGLAIDTSRGLLFYMDMNLSNLHRANLDGTGDVILVPGICGFGMDIDVPNGQVYFTVHGGMPNLVGRVNVDGSNLVGLVPGFTYDTRGLDLDLDAGHIYWTILNQGVFRADLDGTNVVTVVAADPGAGLHDFDGVAVAPPTFHCTNTPVGTDVVVIPPDSVTGSTPVTITFDRVTAAGNTGLHIFDNGPPPKHGFSLCGRYYNVTTTAAYTESVEVCIDYSGTKCNKPRLQHYDGTRWVDVVPSYPGPGADIICGKVSSLSIFAIFEESLIPAVVDIDPDVLNPRSSGRWVTSYIELPEGYNPQNIDVSSVILNEAVPAETSPTSVGDYDSDGVMDRMVKFSRSAVIDTLPHGEYVEVRVSGQVGSEGFVGRDTIRVLMPKVVYPNGGQMLQTGKQYVLNWEVPGGYKPDYYNVFYTADDGNSWGVMGENVSGTSCTWTVPPVISARCRVLVEAYDDKGIMGYDLSDRTFAIGNTGISRPRDVTPISFDLRLTSLNPSVSGALLELDLPEASHVSVVVFDVRGRLVRELVDESRPAGSYLIQWNGKNASGDAVPAGIYLVRVEAGEYRMTEKIVLVR